MKRYFDEESQRADRSARRERRIRDVAGMRACVGLAAFAGAIAFVIGADGPVGEPNTPRGLVAALAVATPFLLLALWGVRWREPRLAPYTLGLLQGDDEARFIVREYADDYTAAYRARAELRGAVSEVSVARGRHDNAVVLGFWSMTEDGPSWRSIVPEWTLYSSLERRS